MACCSDTGVDNAHVNMMRTLSDVQIVMRVESSLSDADIALRSTRNALKLRDSIQLHCEGNPFIVGTPLKSIVSSVLIPETAKEDILHRDEKGLDGYQKFVKERLVPDASMCM